MPCGASGFMSNMSMCDGPPHWKRKMTDFARGLIDCGFSSAFSNPGMVNPSRPMPPTLSAARRPITELNPEQAKFGIGEMRFGLAAEDELLGVYERPGEVFEGAAAIARLGEQLRGA